VPASRLLPGDPYVPSSSLSIEHENAPSAGTRLGDALHNPSYPQRVHVPERARLEEALRSIEERVGQAREKLEAIAASQPNRPALERLYHQMQGARDQVAECVRRMPLETGGLYGIDEERLEQGAAALERAWQRFEKIAG
jgi:hypothetical protein